MSILSALKERNQASKITDPRYYDAEMDQTIADLNQAGISLMDYPKATQHRAFVLEGKITTAANENRREDFNKLLKEWRNCFN